MPTSAETSDHQMPRTQRRDESHAAADQEYPAEEHGRRNRGDGRRQERKQPENHQRNALGHKQYPVAAYRSGDRTDHAGFIGRC
jgi:hypothetical protein